MGAKGKGGPAPGYPNGGGGRASMGCIGGIAPGTWPGGTGAAGNTPPASGEVGGSQDQSPSQPRRCADSGEENGRERRKEKRDGPRVHTCGFQGNSSTVERAIARRRGRRQALHGDAYRRERDDAQPRVAMRPCTRHVYTRRWLQRPRPTAGRDNLNAMQRHALPGALPCSEHWRCSAQLRALHIGAALGAQALLVRGGAGHRLIERARGRDALFRRGREGEHLEQVAQGPGILTALLRDGLWQRIRSSDQPRHVDTWFGSRAA